MSFFEPPASTVLESRTNHDEVKNTKEWRADEAEDSSSHLLEHVPDDFFSHLYVASKSYLNETESSIQADSISTRDQFDLNSVEGSSSTASSIAASLSSLKLQGTQVFAIDDFEDFVDVTSIFEESKSIGVGAGDLGHDAAPVDGGSGDSSGSGNYGSGSDESGSGGQTSRGDSGEAASGSGGEGSGTYFSGSGDGSGSGAGPKETKCCVLQ